MVAVHALCAENVAIGVVHLLLPLLTVCVSAASHRTFRVFDSNIEPINLDMPLFIVASFLLRFARVGIRFRLRICDRSLHGIFFP